MFQLFFDYDKQEKLFTCQEGNKRYKMPLPLMLQLKKYLREEPNLTDDKPITYWYTSLEESEAKQVYIEEV
jgi:hypothetical protein